MSFFAAAGCFAMLKSSRIFVEVVTSNIKVLSKYIRYFHRRYDFGDVNQGSWWMMALNTPCLLAPVLLAGQGRSLWIG